VKALDLAQAIERGCAPMIVDVRSPAEFAEGHVPGAINVPFNEVGKRIGSLPPDRATPLVLYCGHGPRAWLAAASLRRRGYRTIDFVRGHMAAWRRAGLPEQRTSR
jgi:rhodanese-related sulfurtransferase